MTGHDIRDRAPRRYVAWDRATRAFHWINVVCVLSLMALGTVILNGSALGMSNAGKLTVKTLHVYAGYVFVINLS